MMQHIPNITRRKLLFGGRICLGNLSLPSSPHHINYIMYYPNRSPFDTPSVIHQNYPSRKPIPTGLRTLWYPMVYFIINNCILLTSFRVLFRYHKDSRREEIEGKKSDLHLTSIILVVCIYIRFLCILSFRMYVLFPRWGFDQRKPSRGLEARRSCQPLFSFYS